MNFINVKKITLTDLIIALGLGLMVVGLGIKMKSASKVTEENSFVKVEKSEQALVISVNINTASSVELEVLPSIGPKIAQRIIDYRNKWGLFKRKEDIKNVSGIGEKTYEKIMDKIEI
ncbi:MAG: Competence protein ComEA helix-hairpin-helix repeat protein [Candidatus Shapirobacteria bacterium GW2011_GWE1_38_10]|uniref:Competence protein ComEA helix-hairpin-helix repeat protein n=1 Tax=Candidatus Shapirobacteria bacterium GW2011_GWE1_38_10 TaxID=1618488 RepID=A0A0G0LDX8_9BACT|nr:MAG: Competence protein ComEA helix-hairpin-helix repeat protein [Candidatus Shapirobacteria bacterium GW2011_GWF2_37_20]KKQ50871.1 MAG: Competence protein ComEA helix-hairpin-helix repeat protein [Candidatus Shapirobacteria bacterium GW2011_GWE1_38_10]KKQ63639.1 MAG: Competence protein ComEA helix-hairpin-helix repeat protein [Candidatus Shapirobacteria bacterium GW2011_GWF1_38_23]